MKKLLTFISIIFISFSFSDMILTNSGNRIEDVNLLYTNDFKLFYEINGIKNSIYCVSVKKILDNGNNKLELQCNSGYYYYNENLNPKISIKANKNKKFNIGGAFISIGSLMLFSTIDSDCSDCSLTEYENHISGLKTTMKIGYLFFAIGGAMITIGI